MAVSVEVNEVNQEIWREWGLFSNGTILEFVGKWAVKWEYLATAKIQPLKDKLHAEFWTH
jgi:hypothetical protein